MEMQMVCLVELLTGLMTVPIPPGTLDRHREREGMWRSMLACLKIFYVLSFLITLS